MTFWNAALALVLAGGLVGCGSSETKPKDESQAPGSTVAAVPGVPAPAGGSLGAPLSAPAPTSDPAYTYEPEPAPAAAAPATRPPAPATRPGRGTRAPVASRPAPAAPSPERVIEPMEPIEPERASVPRAADDLPPGPESRIRERLVLSEGTELRLILEETLSSETSHEGDRVTARVERALTPDGRVALPGGTVLHGTVLRAESAGRVKGRAHLGVAFNRIVVRGVEHAIDTTALDVQGPDDRGRDAAIVGGGTAGGAILGGILGGGKGAKKGAVIGAIGGAGAVLATKGKEVELPSGSRWSVRVKSDVRFD